MLVLSLAYGIVALVGYSVSLINHLSSAARRKQPVYTLAKWEN
ncbi:sensor protein PhoQ, partial [Salmonella enterica subsp. enterica serovar Heidelberg str. N4403]